MNRHPAPLDLRKLTQFVAVADRLNVTKAAADMYLTQQAVSSSVRQLERDLGVALFDRHGRQIALTPAGYALRAGAEPLLSAARSLAATTVAAAQSDSTPFVVGHSPAIASDEVFDLLAPVRSAFTSVSITVRQMFPEEMQSTLRDGTIDIGLRRGATTPQGLAGAVVGYSTLRVAVPAHHRLAERDSAHITDMADDTIVLWAPPGASFYSDFLVSICQRAGFEPKITINSVQGTMPTTAVIDNDAVAFVTSDPGSYHDGRVRVIAIDGAPLAPIQALWLRHTVSEPRQALLDRG